jgi:hypothetical protein
MQVSSLAQKNGTRNANLEIGQRQSRPGTAARLALAGLGYVEANCTRRGRFVGVVGGLWSGVPEPRIHAGCAFGAGRNSGTEIELLCRGSAPACGIWR